MVEKDLQNLQVSRKLASVQVISNVTQIEGTDMDLCQVSGWKVVTRRDEFKKDETIFFFEIDSKLPDERWSEELSLYDFRVKTVQFENGILSQGLIKPLSIIKDYQNLKVGDDATELLDVTKYLEEEEKENVIENNAFPKFLIPTTEEPRIQSEPKYLEVFKGKPYIATLKYDGTSSSFVLNPDNKDELWVCSRNTLKQSTKKDEYQKIANIYKIKEKLLKVPHMAIQGEIYGPKVQNNNLAVKDLRLAVFNVYDTKNKRCLDYDELIGFCKEMDFPFAEVILKGESFDYDLDKLMEAVRGNYEGTENPREGLVFRLAKNWDMPTIRASFKVINNDYLTQKHSKSKKGKN